MFNTSIRIGESVNNKRIVEEFQCSPQGGMRKSNKTNTLVLVSKHTGTNVYTDKIINGIYHYTGQGMKGDQSLTFAQNKTLSESNVNNVKLHFFDVFHEGEYVYLGEVRLESNPYQDDQVDTEGNLRKVWIFPLRILAENELDSFIDQELLNEQFDQQLKTLRDMDVETLKTRAINSGSQASSRKTTTKTYIRNPFIALYTKRRAQGICELCSEFAPFSDQLGEPYLESHHIIWLSNNGPDTIENTVALCPNCHKRMHILCDKSDLIKLRNIKR
jgi:5-methylcytosine-specific restriction protein A